MNIQKTFNQKIDRLCGINPDFAKVWSGIMKCTGIITGQFIRQILDEDTRFFLEIITDDDIQLPMYKMKMIKTPSFIQKNGKTDITAVTYTCPGFMLSIPNQYEWKRHVDISIHKLYYDIKAKTIKHYNNQKIRTVSRIFQEINSRKFRIQNDKYLCPANADHVIRSMIEVINIGYKIDIDDKTTCDNIKKILERTTIFYKFDNDIRKYKLVKQILQFANLHLIDYALHIASIVGDMETFQIINWDWRNETLINVCHNLIKHRHHQILDELKLIKILDKRIPCQIRDMILEACKTGNLPALYIIEKDCATFMSNFRYFGKCCDSLCYIAHQDDVKLLHYVEEKGLLNEFREKKSEAVLIALQKKNINVAKWLYNKGFRIDLKPDYFYRYEVWCKEFFDTNNHEALSFCHHELGTKYDINELYYAVSKGQASNVEFLLTKCHFKYRINIKDSIFDTYLSVRNDKEWLLLLLHFKKISKIRTMMYHILKKKDYKFLVYFLLDGRLSSQLIDHIGKFLS